jgi:hypothetical protein
VPRELLAVGRGRLPATKAEAEPGRDDGVVAGGRRGRDLLDLVALVEEAVAVGEELAEAVHSPPHLAVVKARLEVGVRTSYIMASAAA